MRLIHIVEKTTSEDDIISLLFELELIKSTRVCTRCLRQMHMEKGKCRHGVDRRWRCSVRSCRSSVSLFKDSVFERVHIPIRSCLMILYFKSMRLSCSAISTEVDVARQHVASFIDAAMLIFDQMSANETFGPIGGPGEIVEVDETHMVTRRDARGRILTGERYWIIGGVCRRTRQSRCLVTRFRRRAECEAFVLSTVAPGTLIMTDKWRGYNRLDTLGYSHETIDHSREFVSQTNQNIHTQTIERHWRTIKENTPQVNTFELLEKHLNRFLFDYNSELLNHVERFEFLLRNLKTT